MTAVLERAFAEASKLTEAEQDAIGRWLLAELEDDRKWDVAFARSPEVLSDLASVALDEHRAGRTEELDPEKL